MTADHKSNLLQLAIGSRSLQLFSSQEPAKKVCSAVVPAHRPFREAERRKLVNRSKRIEGQIRGYYRMR